MTAEQEIHLRLLEAEANGQVYQAIASASASAVQKATEVLRDLSEIAATAEGDTDAQTWGTKPYEEILEFTRKILLKKTISATDPASFPEISVALDKLAEAGANDVADRLRAAINATSASFESLDRAVVQIAATAVSLKRRIAQPEKAASYEEVLAAIRPVV